MGLTKLIKFIKLSLDILNKKWSSKMGKQTPAFLLRVANALVDEIAEKIAQVQSWKDVNTYELEKNLSLSVDLADKVARSNPNIELNDGTTPTLVKARAFFYRGYIAMRTADFKEAVKYFEESLRYHAEQSTYFNLGLCFLMMKGLFQDRTQDAISAFQKCIDLNPETEVAINAGKELARLGQL
jgi:tetratricopeptide (TPR) repeat protein